jgi:hypothetical protein
MALFSPSASPAVTVREIDLTAVAPNVQTSTGAFVGNFRWGPVNERTLVADESGLVTAFAAPNTTNAVDFHSAAYFLKYSNSLYIVRGNNGGVNAHSAVASLGDSAVVENLDNWNNSVKDAVSEAGTKTGSFIAKYPGLLGNALSVSFCPAGDSAGGSTINFNAWSYKSSFDRAPGTSAWASARGGSNDEVHVAVIDRTGAFSGTPGTVLETFPHLSVANGAVSPDNSPNYVSDVINNNSRYIWNGYFGDDSAFGSSYEGLGNNWGNTPSVDSATNFGVSGWSNSVATMRLKGGVESSALSTGQIATGFDRFEDKDAVTVDFLISPQVSALVDATTVVNDLVSIAAARKDCIAVTSPYRAGIVGSTTPVTNAVTFADTLTNSSYLVVDNNYLKVFDKYNDQYINIPAASSTAGLMAATDLVAAPWFSPAGQRRGNYLGVTDIVVNPSKTERDTLYKASVNPVANIPGTGVVLFGDKTHENRPSAFDRINVRRLFLALERSISLAGQNVMFEFNDEFTRAEFVNVVDPLLREIQGRRGITDYRIVCDETNNTDAVIDNNEFVASIFVKPARSINYVTLNFVAVRTGVDFEEVVGTV